MKYLIGSAVFSAAAIASYIAGNAVGWALLTVASVACAVAATIKWRRSKA